MFTDTIIRAAFVPHFDYYKTVVDRCGFQVLHVQALKN